MTGCVASDVVTLVLVPIVWLGMLAAASYTIARAARAGLSR